MEFEMKSNTRPGGRYWTDPRCSPTRESMESMYSAGFCLYVDGVKQTKAKALASIPKDLYCLTYKPEED